MRQIETERPMVRCSVPDTGTCIHGDLHGGNALITDDGKEYFIDLADFCYGNPLFDIGTLYYTSMQIDEPMTQRLFHCGEAQMHRFWNAFAKAYFNVTTDEEVLAINETVAPFAALKVIFFAELDQWAPGMRELVEAALLK